MPVMHVHIARLPNGPLLVSSAAPTDDTHVHTFVILLSGDERLHVTSPPFGGRGLDHEHRVSLPGRRSIFLNEIVDTGSGIRVPPLGQRMGFPRATYPSAWRVQRRFPARFREVARGFEDGCPGGCGLSQGPLGQEMRVFELEQRLEAMEEPIASLGESAEAAAIRASWQRLLTDVLLLKARIPGVENAPAPPELLNQAARLEEQIVDALGRAAPMVVSKPAPVAPRAPFTEINTLLGIGFGVAAGVTVWRLLLRA